eukprot:s1893_g1.t1
MQFHDRSSRTNELRTRKNSFGSLVADAMHWQFSSEGCDGAIINGGFVRQDRGYPPGSALSRAMINEEMPFNKRIALQKLTGHQLRTGLEEMLAPTPTPVACFPQLSHSLRLRYAPTARDARQKFTTGRCGSAEAMQKIQSLQIHGVEVDPQRDYLIAVSEFYTLDGVKTFHEADVLQMHDGLIRDTVANYLHTKKEISAFAKKLWLVLAKSRLELEHLSSKSLSIDPALLKGAGFINEPGEDHLIEIQVLRNASQKFTADGVGGFSVYIRI